MSHIPFVLVIVFAGVTALNAQTREAPLRVGGSVSPPKRTTYLPATLEAGMPPLVAVLELLINPTGRVSRVKALKGQPAIANAAVAAAKQWTYEPTMVGGKYVWLTLVTTVEVGQAKSRPSPSQVPLSAGGTASGRSAEITAEGRVRVASGRGGDGRHLGLVSLADASGVRVAFLIVYPSQDARLLVFDGNAKIAGRVTNRLTIVPASGGDGWELFTPGSVPEHPVKPDIEPVPVLSIEALPIASKVTHEQLMRTHLRTK